MYSHLGSQELKLVGRASVSGVEGPPRDRLRFGIDVLALPVSFPLSRSWQMLALRRASGYFSAVHLWKEDFRKACHR